MELNPYQTPQADVNLPVILPKRPRIVSLGIIIMLVVTSLGFVYRLFNFDLILQLLKVRGGHLHNNENVINFLHLAFIVTMIFFTSIKLLLYYFIAKGRNWARITLFVLFCIDMLFAIKDFMPMFNVSVVWASFAALSFGIDIVAFICIFSKKSNEWFRAVKAIRSEQ